MTYHVHFCPRADIARAYSTLTFRCRAVDTFTRAFTFALGSWIARHAPCVSWRSTGAQRKALPGGRRRDAPKFECSPSAQSSHVLAHVPCPAKQDLEAFEARASSTLHFPPTFLKDHHEYPSYATRQTTHHSDPSN